MKRLAAATGDATSRLRDNRLSRRRFLKQVAGATLLAGGVGALTACSARAAKHLSVVGVFEDLSSTGKPFVAAMRQQLATLGYVDGRTIRIEDRYAEGDQSRWSDIARELVRLHPAVIIADGLPWLLVARAYTTTIPLVVIAGVVTGPEELVTRGLISSQEHPGGNVTGIVGSTPTLWSKRLDLLHETVPSATRIGALMDSDNPVAAWPAWMNWVTAMVVRRPADLDRVFAAAQEDEVEALAVAVGGGHISSFIDQVAAKARDSRLPAICDWDRFVPAGGLMSYAADDTSTHRDAARLVAKILDGTSPADVPVEVATSFGLHLNRTTAGAIGLDIPGGVLAQATEVVG